MCLPTAISRWPQLMVLVLVMSGTYQLLGAAVIKAKAWLAPVLIERAWEQSIALGGASIKPWPWADTWPVARLQATDLDVDLLVLAGDSGNALAFGPGHSLASATLGGNGMAVIGGHRDTHFAFLQQIQLDAPLQLQLPDGSWQAYRVDKLTVEDIRVHALQQKNGDNSLLLVTCYPFNSLSANGPLRYVVAASPENRSNPALH